MGTPIRALAAALALICLTACATVEEDTGMPNSSSTSGTSGTSSTSSPSGSSTAPADPVPSPPPPFEMAAQRRATAAYPPPEALPDGWIQVDPTKELPGYPGDPVYCGVRLERETAKGSALHLYRASDAGPYVLQYTFILERPVAEQVMADLAPAVQSCIAAGRDDHGHVFAPITPATVGEESVSVAFVSTGGASSQVTVFRRGDALVAVIGFFPAGLPPVEALGAIATSIDGVLTTTT